jgi:hypothetical protein
MRALSEGDGNLKKKKVFKTEHRMTKRKPMNAARTVKTTNQLYIQTPNGKLTWHISVIDIRDGSSDFWIWTVLV